MFFGRPQIGVAALPPLYTHYSICSGSENDRSWIARWNHIRNLELREGHGPPLQGFRFGRRHSQLHYTNCSKVSFASAYHDRQARFRQVLHLCAQHQSLNKYLQHLIHEQHPFSHFLRTTDITSFRRRITSPSLGI